MAATTTLVHSETAASENPVPRRVRRGSICFPGGTNPCPVCGVGLRDYRARRRHERRAHADPDASVIPSITGEEAT